MRHQVPNSMNRQLSGSERGITAANKKSNVVSLLATALAPMVCVKEEDIFEKLVGSGEAKSRRVES